MLVDRSTKTVTSSLPYVRFLDPFPTSAGGLIIILTFSAQSQYNGGSHCGQSVTITDTNTGNTQTAVVADLCPGCGGDSIDMSVGLFTAFAPESVGVIPGKLILLACLASLVNVACYAPSFMEFQLKLSDRHTHSNCLWKV